MEEKENLNDWNAGQYLKFTGERTRPSRDLAGSIAVENASTALDVGCGPGNSSRVLRDFFPDAEVTGIDSSPEMIAKAQKDYPELTFRHLQLTPDCRQLDGEYDIIFSNACIQWIPDHRLLLRSLFARVSRGGALAIQLPMTKNMPMSRILRQLQVTPRWQPYLRDVRRFHTLEREEYYDIAAELTGEFSIWQTEFMHALPGYEGVIEWYRGSGLRPCLAALPEELHADFLAEVSEALPEYYRIRPDGKLLMPFPRLFMVLQKPR